MQVAMDKYKNMFECLSRPTKFHIEVYYKKGDQRLTCQLWSCHEHSQLVAHIVPAHPPQMGHEGLSWPLPASGPELLFPVSLHRYK